MARLAHKSTGPGRNPRTLKYIMCDLQRNLIILLADNSCTLNVDNSITGTVVEDRSWCSHDVPSVMDWQSEKIAEANQS